MINARTRPVHRRKRQLYYFYNLLTNYYCIIWNTILYIYIHTHTYTGSNKRTRSSSHEFLLIKINKKKQYTCMVTVAAIYARTHLSFGWRARLSFLIIFFPHVVIVLTLNDSVSTSLNLCYKSIAKK